MSVSLEHGEESELMEEEVATFAMDWGLEAWGDFCACSGCLMVLYFFFIWPCRNEIVSLHILLMLSAIVRAPVENLSFC